MFSYEEIRRLNGLEMSVYNYVIKNKEKVIYMKIRDLADCTNVSTTTILRFCKKVGCAGFTDFKMQLKLYLEDCSDRHPDMDISAMLDFFQRAETQEFKKTLDKSLAILKKAALVIFIGTGASGVLGKYGARYFNNIGQLSLCIDDPFTPIYQGDNRTIAVIALSVSGTTEQTLHLANQLKKRGCRLISITNSVNTPLAQISDCSISYYLPIARINGQIDLSSQIPVMYTLETLGRRLYRNQLV